MRAVKRKCAGIALALVATLASSGCGVVSSTTVSDAPGKSLEFVEDRLQPDVTLLIQDVSPRVGLAASYGLGDDGLWTVVALCADSAVLDNATSVEVAVVPQRAVDVAVRNLIRDGAFRAAVDCDGRDYAA